MKDKIDILNIKGSVLFNEPMKKHTSFKIGGPADVYIIPYDTCDLKKIYKLCSDKKIPFFILGQGANILVSDKGIRGIVIDLSNFSKIKQIGQKLSAGAGTLVTDLVTYALNQGLSGLEFLHLMPGSVGGALWMNARCYGKEIGEIVQSAEILDTDLCVKNITLSRKNFNYKKSPFQGKNLIILNALFSLNKENTAKIKESMKGYQKDREKKGHFLFPSAGSIFKNNTELGKSTGEIIDSLSLKGYSVGGAQVSEYHANIIINKHNASAMNVFHLIKYIEEKVKKDLGFSLEREVILVGDFKEDY